MRIIPDPIDHSYVTEYGQILCPVTTLIKLTPRAIDFASLPKTKAIENARERGTMIHEEFEDFLKNGTRGITKSFEWFAQCLYPLFTNWESEVIVYSDDEATPYAGTIDLICKNNDRWVLIDLKTGGHETVDYQLSLYKRAFCKNRGIDPDLVDLACIDAKDEDDIGFFRVRTISAKWLDNLLFCYANDIPYIEPLPTLKGFDENQLANLTTIEAYISEIEAMEKKYKAMRDKYREQLYQAMDDALVDNFEFGSIRVTRVKPSVSTSFDTELFKKENAELYKKYLRENRKKGYLKVTVRDVTRETK